MDFTSIEPIAAALVGAPFVAGIVQLMKLPGVIPNRFLPYVSIALGTTLGCIAFAITGDVALVSSGFGAGLAASGLYDAIIKPKSQ